MQPSDSCSPARRLIISLTNFSHFQTQTIGDTTRILMEKETDIQNVNDQKWSLKIILILRYTLLEALSFFFYWVPFWPSLCWRHKRSCLIRMHQRAVVIQRRYLPGTSFSAVSGAPKTRTFKVQIKPRLLPKQKRRSHLAAQGWGGQGNRGIPFKVSNQHFLFQSHTSSPPS